MYSTNKNHNYDKPPLASSRLLDQLRERLRYLHYSLRTEKTYVFWVRWFIRWHGIRHPRDMGEKEVEAFLSMLANERKVAPVGGRSFRINLSVRKWFNDVGSARMFVEFTPATSHALDRTLQFAVCATQSFSPALKPAHDWQFHGNAPRGSKDRYRID